MKGQGRIDMSEAGAIEGAEFDTLMASLGIDLAKPRLAVAVSGGADSMALVLLVSEWVRAQDGEVVGLIVDHGLRPESKVEAQRVADRLKDKGISAQVLTWAGPKPSSSIQAEARAARYKLLVEKCEALGLRHLLVAHHKDDQAETFMLRLSRGSGVDGLACMAPISQPDVSTSTQVRLLRPFLTVPKARLIATLQHRGVPWVEDPSNQCLDFTRVRLREVLKGLAGEGFSSGRLSRAARRMARARDALNKMASEFVSRVGHFDNSGFCEIKLTDLRATPEEISLRGLLIMLHWAGGHGNVIRLERAERLHEEIIGADSFGGRTLGGCRVQLTERPQGLVLMICREAAAAQHELHLAPGTEANWDGRYKVALAADSDSRSQPVQPLPSLLVRRLGEDGWRQISSEVSADARANIPVAVRSTLPALWDPIGVVSVPIMGFEREGLTPVCRTFTTDFTPSRADFGI